MAAHPGTIQDPRVNIEKILNLLQGSTDKSPILCIDDDPKTNPLCDAFANDCFRRAIVDIVLMKSCDSNCLSECSFVKFEVTSISEREMRPKEKLGGL